MVGMGILTPSLTSLHVHVHVHAQCIHLFIYPQSKFLVVMMSTGQIYFQPIIPECNASEGPVYFTIDFVVEHANIKVSRCNHHVIIM